MARSPLSAVLFAAAVLFGTVALRGSATPVLAALRSSPDTTPDGGGLPDTPSSSPRCDWTAALEPAGDDDDSSAIAAKTCAPQERRDWSRTRNLSESPLHASNSPSVVSYSSVVPA